MSKEIALSNNWETTSNLKIEHDPRISTIEQLRDDISEDEDYPRFPNMWAKTRHYLAEPFAEFLGVLILILFGNGVICQVALSADPNITSPHGEWLSINFGWAAGAAMAVWVCAGVSGAHINPAITLALAVWRGFPWRKVPLYIFAQVLGGVVGAAIVYANYYRAIDTFEGGQRTLKTAGFFASYALDYLPNISAFYSEFMSTAVFVMGILSILDKTNAAPSLGMFPVGVFILVLAMGTALGMNTGYALNPARDLGPRLMTAMVGYGLKVFTFRGQYWFWCNIIATCMGAQLGTFIYDALIYTGEDSILNRPNKSARRAHINVNSSQRGKSPAPIPMEGMV